MLIDEMHKEINSKLRTQLVTPRVLLDKLRLIDDDSRRSSQYQDPNYLPFYYYLSKFIQPKSVFHLGLNLGLPLCCFLSGCSSAERVFCFQRKSKQFYSPRLALSNIRDVKGRKFPLDYHFGEMVDREMEEKMRPGFDLVMITEKTNGDQTSEALDVCWDRLHLDGFLVLDHAGSNLDIGRIFHSFCKSKNRPFVSFSTRYGTCLVQK